MIYPQGLLAGQDIELQQQEERVRILDKEVRGACMNQRACARVCVRDGASAWLGYTGLSFLPPAGLAGQGA